jgi:hypothetical protein
MSPTFRKKSASVTTDNEGGGFQNWEVMKFGDVDVSEKHSPPLPLTMKRQISELEINEV